MEKRRIRKAKLKNRSLEVELTETISTEQGDVTNEVIMKCAGLAHDDLKKAFDRLSLHMIVICDLRKSEMIDQSTFDSEDIDDFNDYEVKGFSLGGEDEHEGVVLIGSRKFKSGKVLNIVTPFTRFADENDPYDFESELYNDIQAAVYEVEQYLFEGKYAIKQLELGFEDAEVPEEVAA